MPAIKEQSVEDARHSIEEMLSALGESESPGFSKYALNAESIQLLDCERNETTKKGRIVVEMQVSEGMSNQLGNMHGGCAATILDNITSMVLYLHTTGVFGEPWSMLGVSQSIQIIYTAPAPVGEYIDIECVSLAVGKSVAVIQVSSEACRWWPCKVLTSVLFLVLKCEMWTKDSKGGKRLKRTCTGTHTKIDNSGNSKL
jgi:acyl-coenzyme A thioesterase 13